MTTNKWGWRDYGYKPESTAERQARITRKAIKTMAVKKYEYLQKYNLIPATMTYEQWREKCK